MEAAGGGVGDSADPASSADRLAALVEAYRLYAVAHPDLYRLMNHLPFRRDPLPEGTEEPRGRADRREPSATTSRAPAPSGLSRMAGGLEIDGRFADRADRGRPWAVGLGSLMITAHEHTVQQ